MSTLYAGGYEYVYVVGGDGKVVYRNLQSWVTSEVQSAVQQALDDLPVTDAPARARGEWSLRTPVPNPFNPRTELFVEFTGAQSRVVALEVIDARGRIVRRLLEGVEVSAPGITVRWDGLDDQGNAAASGAYHFRLVTPAGVQSVRGVLIR